MNYPTIARVRNANKFLLAVWLRFLPSPGSQAADEGKTLEDISEATGKESQILDYILARFNALGGWNPSLSKAVGHKNVWD
jgi:hypothetical protein